MDSRVHQESASEEGVSDALLHKLLQMDSLLDRLNTADRHAPNNHPELAKELDQHGSTALHSAAAAGDREVVKELLTRAGSDLGLVQDKCGMLAIHVAALKGEIEALCELFDACPDSRREVTCHSDTVMHLAVKSNCFEAVQFLVERLDGDVELLNAKNAKGNTMLHLAVGRKQAETVKLLLSRRGIDVNAMNMKSFTPLDVLLESPSEIGDMALASMLLAAGGKRAAEVVQLPGKVSATDNSILAAKAQSSVHSASNCSSKPNCNSFMQFAGIMSENDEFIFFLLLVSSSLCTALAMSTNAMLQLFPNSVYRMLFNYHTRWLWLLKTIVAWVLTAHLFVRLSKKLRDRRPEDAVERKDEQQKARKPPREFYDHLPRQPVVMLSSPARMNY